MAILMKRSWLPMLDLVGTIVVLAAGGVLVWRTISTPSSPEARPSASPQINSFQLSRRTSIGSESAQVALVEFTDFECPFCRRFETDVLPVLEQRYISPGRLRFIVMQYPLPRHVLARAAAEAAICAGEQGKYWQFHRSLTSMAPPEQGWDHLDLAERAGLSIPQFKKCRLTLGPFVVTAEAAVGEQMRFTGTPGFVVGRIVDADRIKIDRAFTGALPAQEFIAALDKIMSR